MTGPANPILARAAEAAAKRGEKIVGYYGDADGRHFRFVFAPIKPAREPRHSRPEEPRRVARGVASQGRLL